MYKDGDKITIGSGSERNTEWTITNIRTYNTKNYYTCGVCHITNVCCDLVSDGQETITINTGSINGMIEKNDQYEPAPIEEWRKDVYRINEFTGSE